MSFLNALILGIVQGLTEFLPISSSAHLIVIPKLLNWQSQPLVFDTTLHLATALSLIVCFWNDTTEILRSFIKDVFSSHKFKFKEYSDDSMLGLKIIIGSIPVGVVGYLYGDTIEDKFRGTGFVFIFLILGSLLMYVAEKKFKKRLFIKEDISLKKSFNVGLFQVLSLFPGVSRSGATISGSMLFGLDRKEAARFSFLLSIPAVVAAGIFSISSSLSYFSMADVPPLFISFVSSFLVGIFAIKFLLKFVQKNKLYPFIVYRLFLAGIIFLFIK